MSGFMQSQTALLASQPAAFGRNGHLKMLAQQTQQQKRELQELQALGGLQQHGVQAVATAEVISNGKDPLSDKLIINEGSRNGLQNGDAVD